MVISLQKTRNDVTIADQMEQAAHASLAIATATSLCLSLSLTHSLSLSLSLSLSIYISLCCSFSLSLTHTHTPSHTLSLKNTHYVHLSLSLSHTHSITDGASGARLAGDRDSHVPLRGAPREPPVDPHRPEAHPPHRRGLSNGNLSIYKRPSTGNLSIYWHSDPENCPSIFLTPRTIHL